jgi:NAD(P)H-flavin reductase
MLISAHPLAAEPRMSEPSPSNAQLYRPAEAEILAVTELTPNEKLFRLRLADGSALNHQPGQFVQVALPGIGEAPISVASSPTRGPEFELGVRRVGRLTDALHRLEAGASIGIRGPFGRGYDLSALRSADLLLIAGGCGLAPLRSLIQYCEDRRGEFAAVTILYGAKSPRDVMFRADLDRWQQLRGFTCSRSVDSREDGDCFSGSVGLVTALIPPLQIDAQRSVAVVIGPPPMYRGVIAELRAKGLSSSRIALSLERQMRCGVGKCGHCAIEHLLCCQDGPVFWLSDVEQLRGAL